MPAIQFGDKFGRWTVSEKAPPRDSRNRTRFWCVCECGTRRPVEAAYLNNGASRSCGTCVRREFLKTEKPQTTHGLANKVPEYRIWKSIIKRCYNARNPDYPNYGGRGLRVWDGWRGDFAAFYAYMGQRPGAGRQWHIGRIDNERGYEPGNVRWETVKQNMQNKRTSRHVVAFGRTQTVSAWCQEMKIANITLTRRLDSGLAPELALTLPIGTKYASLITTV